MKVFNLSTAKEFDVEASDPKEAVILAFKKANPDMPVPVLTEGGFSVACGDFAAKTKDFRSSADQRHAELSARAREKKEEKTEARQRIGLV